MFFSSSETETVEELSYGEYQQFLQKEMVEIVDLINNWTMKDNKNVLQLQLENQTLQVDAYSMIQVLTIS